MFQAYICDPPFAFRSFWSIIKHFIDVATLKKIAFCTGKEGEVLLERVFDTATTDYRETSGRDEEVERI